ncbi:putative dehydrogenase [Rhizobium sp. BK529]|uniref:Gfo/Idh/MocA family protein n=1 Tax=unclassified Rhizobium TaxID=2613769 RepID=UPI0010482A76|nr:MULTISPECIES: Gfo/Idh/MocA family oxidoreductase [unclassified Rhizobium]MBB3594029.1 putative dehydrogenase [Rhizobium sp. BK529]TCS01484.1 putative dehydrogenase [Rhizobium sp. BK418]
MPAPSCTRPLEIAVMGVGLIGRRHIEGVLAEPRAALAAVIDPSPAARDEARANGFTWFASLTEALADRRPDGVIVATPNQLHVANASDAVTSGIPVLIEKPIADDSVAAAGLVAAAERAGVPVLVGHHRRHNPLIREARRIIDSGRLGKIRAVHGSFWVAKPDDYFNVQWRREPGAGPTFINLIHDVDLFRYLLGEVESVHAMDSNAARGHAVEDTAVVLLRFESGVLATLTASDAVPSPWSWEMTSGENPAYPQQDQFCYQIGGTEASLAIPQLALWRNALRPDWREPLIEERLTVAEADPLTLQLQHFCDIIEGKAKPLVSGQEGLATLEVIEAIKQSARTGKTVFPGKMRDNTDD